MTIKQLILAGASSEEILEAGGTEADVKEAEKYREKIKEKLEKETKKECEVKVLKVDDKKKQIRFLVTTDTVDRDGEILTKDGWDIENYKKNNVVLADHIYSIKNVIGKAEIEFTKKGMEAVATFAVKENKLAEFAYKMYKAGFLHAVSVGFRPTKGEFKEVGNEQLWHILEKEMLEFSAVAVPANPEALSLAAKSIKVKKEDLEKVFLKQIEEKENEFRHSVREAAEFDQETFRSFTLQKEPRVRAIWGIHNDKQVRKIKAIRFPKDEWTDAKARDWLDEHIEEIKNGTVSVSKETLGVKVGLGGGEEDEVDFDEELEKHKEAILTASKILSKNHDELKAYRRLSVKVTELLGIKRTEDEVKDIKRMMLILVSLLSQKNVTTIKTSKTPKQKTTKPSAAPKQKAKAQPANNLSVADVKAITLEVLKNQA